MPNKVKEPKDDLKEIKQLLVKLAKLIEQLEKNQQKGLSSEDLP